MIESEHSIPEKEIEPAEGDYWSNLHSEEKEHYNSEISKTRQKQDKPRKSPLKELLDERAELEKTDGPNVVGTPKWEELKKKFSGKL